MLTSRLRLAALIPVTTAAVAACASPASSHQTSSGGSCASGSPSAHLAAARTAFTGIALPGPAIHTSHGSILISPARIHVTRYLKGSGPSVVSVTTASTRAGGQIATNEDGIEPQAGQRWIIYTASQHMPYAASICNGTTLATGKG